MFQSYLFDQNLEEKKDFDEMETENQEEIDYYILTKSNEFDKTNPDFSSNPKVNLDFSNLKPYSYDQDQENFDHLFYKEQENEDSPKNGES